MAFKSKSVVGRCFAFGTVHLGSRARLFIFIMKMIRSRTKVDHWCGGDLVQPDCGRHDALSDYGGRLCQELLSILAFTLSLKTTPKLTGKMTWYEQDYL